MIQLENVTICYPQTWFKKPKPVVQNISFLCKPGTITCIVGTNGTGKSTLLKAIAGLISITSGTLNRSSDIFGYIPEQCTIPQWLTAYDTLWYALRFCKKQTTKDDLMTALEKVNLYEHAHKTVASLSKGMKQRLAFAEILVCNPELILLDEPFSGLDTRSKKLIENLIVEFKTQNKTIVCTAHTDDEIAADFYIHLKSLFDNIPE